MSGDERKMNVLEQDIFEERSKRSARMSDLNLQNPQSRRGNKLDFRHVAIEDQLVREIRYAVAQHLPVEFPAKPCGLRRGEVVQRATAQPVSQPAATGRVEHGPRVGRATGEFVVVADNERI